MRLSIGLTSSLQRGVREKKCRSQVGWVSCGLFPLYINNSNHGTFPTVNSTPRIIILEAATFYPTTIGSGDFLGRWFHGVGAIFI